MCGKICVLGARLVGSGIVRSVMRQCECVCVCVLALDRDDDSPRTTSAVPHLSFEREGNQKAAPQEM